MTTAANAGVEDITFPWWLVLLEGIASIILGLFLLSAPGATLLVLVQVLGFFWLVGGIFRIVSLFIDRSLWGWKLVAGILGVLAGILVLQNPLWSTILVPAVIVIIIGVQGLIQGVLGLILAFQGGGWGIGILGVLSIIFGIILLINPWLGAVVFPIVLGAFMLVGGIFAVIAAIRLRSSPATTAA